MAVEAGSVEVEIRARLDKFERDLGRVRRDLGRFDQQGSQAIRNVERNTRSMSQAFGVAARAAGALIAAFSAQQLIQAADSVSLVTARIGLYTRTAAEAEQITAKLFDVSRQTGVTFNSLAETYARLAPAQDKLNLSSQQLLNISEAVGSAFRVSGASAQEAANATIQLSQAFASGELRGEELRSVMEQGQRIMIALQNQTGKTTGELREMAEAGQLTADVVANALLAELPKLRDEIGRLPDTAAVGFTRLSASFTQLIANINEATGATENISGVMTSLANVIDRINERSFGDLQVQLRMAREEIERLETQGSSFERFVSGALDNALLQFRVKLIEARESVRFLRDEIAPATVAIFNAGVAMDRTSENAERISQQIDWQAKAAEDLANSWVRAASEIDNASGTVSSASQEVSDEVQTLIGRLERQRIQFEQGAVAAALYAAEIAKGAPLNEAEAEAVRENAAAVERLTAARRADQEAQRDAQRRDEALGELSDEVDQRERLLEALQQGQQAYRDMEAVIEAENFARSNGIAIGSQQYQTVLDLVRAMRNLERETDDYTEAQERANDVMAKAKERSVELDRQLQKTADQISEDIISAFSRGWEDGLDRVAEMIRRWALENLIFEPIIRPIIQGAMGVPGAGAGMSGGIFGGGQGGFGGIGGIFGGMNAIGARLGGQIGSFAGNTAINMGANAGTASFLANAGYNLGASAPTSFVTGQILSAFGMDGAGGTEQAIADTIAGAIGQSVAGPIGAAIATALSRAVGGLFRDEDYPYARSDIAIRNGRAEIIGGETLDGGDLGAINQAAQGIADAINSALGALGASGDFGGGTTFGTASGRSAALGSGFFAGSGGGFAGGATFTNVKDAEDAAARAVAFALSQAVGEGAIDLPDILGNQFEAAMRIFEQNAFDIDKSIADLNFAKDFESSLEALSNAALDYSDTIEGAARQQVQAAVQPLRDFIATTERLGLGTERAEAAVQSYLEALINGTSQEQLNPAEQALMALNAQFAAIREVAEEFGLSLDQVDEGLARATEQLREGFLAAIQDQVYQLEGRGFITQGRGVVSQFQRDFAQAQSLGVDPTLLIRRAVLDLERLARNLSPEELRDFADNLGNLPPELQLAEAALQEYALRIEASTEAQREAARQLDDTRAAIEDQIRAEELRADMLRANADLSQAAFQSLSDQLRTQHQISDQQNQNAIQRASQLQQEGKALFAIGQQVSQFASSLAFRNISPVSVLDQFNQAQSQFDALLQAARGGDTEAAGNLTGAAQTLLELNAQINRSGVAGSGLFENVREQLASVGASLSGRGARISADAQAQVDRLNRIAEGGDERLNQLAELLGVSDDGFDGVRSAILESIQAAIANGQTFEQYLAANQSVFDALGGQDFDFVQFASEAFQEAANSFALSEERQAQIEAAEAALARASEALEAVLSAGPGIEARFNELTSRIQVGGVQIEGALAGLSNAITGAAADFDARVEDVLVNDIQPVVEEIRGLRNDAAASADRSARLAASTLDAIERNFRSDQPVIVGGVRLQA